MTTSLESHANRIVSLIDMDCFYVQVEEVEQPQYRGQPCGVSQYNPYRGGSLIAVNYQARDYKVKRGMRGEDAKKLCPNFHTFYVPQNRGKADLTKYREASYKIFDIITKHCPNVEKASVDEAYLDLTDLVEDRLAKMEIIDPEKLLDSYVVGSYTSEESAANDRESNLKAWLESIMNITERSKSTDIKLAIGALIVKEIRNDIFKTLGFACSAGLAHNKTLAKLCCGINKPNKQTILPLSAHEGLMAKTPIQKIKNLGGKLGVILTEEMELKTMGDLAKLSLQDLSKQFGEKTGNWLHLISRGIDLELVLSRQTAKSIGCSKRFIGKSALSTTSKVTYWVKNLSEELEERLGSDKERNQREASLMVIHVTSKAGTFSKSVHITKYCKKYFSELALETLRPFNKSSKPDLWQPGINILGISASKFIDLNKSKSNKTSNPLLKYFTNAPKKEADQMKSDQTEVKNSSESLSSEIRSLTDNIADAFDTQSMGNDQPTTSKQCEEISKHDESDLDAENFTEDSNDIQIIDQAFEGADAQDMNNSPVSNNPGMNLSSDPKQALNQINNATDNYEEIDYVRCDKCGKRILAWEFPEHEDFHFAQELSKQICMPNPTNVLTTSNEMNTKKRPASETPTKNEAGKKSTVKTKKIRTETSVPKKPGKSIDSFFKKK